MKLIIQIEAIIESTISIKKCIDCNCNVSKKSSRCNLCQ
uniref:Uncharacterized protein n=1 Tax=viral metagenome TaxID=1070528 RepID=A0A6C0EDG2_9ZZZZ